VIGLDAGRERASDPLTIKMFEASICVFLPSFSTLTFPGPRSDPALRPFHFILLEQKFDALGVLLYDLSLRAMMLAQLILSPLTSNPSSAPFLKCS